MIVSSFLVMQHHSLMLNLASWKGQLPLLTPGIVFYYIFVSLMAVTSPPLYPPVLCA